MTVWIFDLSCVILSMTPAVVGTGGCSVICMGVWREEIRTWKEKGEVRIVDFPWCKPFSEFAFEGWEMMVDKGIIS